LQVLVALAVVAGRAVIALGVVPGSVGVGRFGVHLAVLVAVLAAALFALAAAAAAMLLVVVTCVAPCRRDPTGSVA